MKTGYLEHMTEHSDMTAPTEMEEDDALLMQKTAHGDSRAFSRLVARHLAATVRTATRILGNAAEAEDVAQEAFLRVWKHAPSWETPDRAGAQFTTWLYRIVLNLCIDHKRKQSFAALDDVVEPADGRDNAETALLRRQQSARVKQAIDALPERQREAFVLCFYEERSNKDAADILCVSVKALESLLVRARRHLYDKLQTEKTS